MSELPRCSIRTKPISIWQMSRDDGDPLLKASGRIEQGTHEVPIVVPVHPCLKHKIRKNAHKISGPAVVCAVHRVMMTEWRVFANYFPTTLIINIFVPRTESDRLHGWPSHNCKHCQLQSSYSSTMFCTCYIWLPPLKGMTAYQRVLLKLGTIHPTSQNSMDCQTHVGSRPMGEHVL